MKMEQYMYNRAHYETSGFIYETSIYGHSIKSEIKTWYISQPIDGQIHSLGYIELSLAHLCSTETYIYW